MIAAPACSGRTVPVFAGLVAGALVVGGVIGFFAGRMTAPAITATVSSASPPATSNPVPAAPASVQPAAKVAVLPTTRRAEGFPLTALPAVRPTTITAPTPQERPKVSSTAAAQPTSRPAAAIAQGTPATAPVQVVDHPTTAPVAVATIVPTTAPSGGAIVVTPTTAPTNQLAAPNPGNALTDEQLENAIRRGVDFIFLALKNGEIPPEKDPISETRRKGLHALCVYALLTAGRTINDPRLDANGPVMTAFVEKLKGFDLTPRYDMPYQAIVYARSLRASALALRNRPEDRAALKADVDWLVAAQYEGGFCFDDRYTNPAARSFLDRSISQAANPASYWDHGSQISRNSLYMGSAPPPVHICHPGRGAVIRFRPGSLVNPFRPPQRDPTVQLANWFPWDNYNSQFAVMGIAAGAEVGIAVPQGFWQVVTAHWQNCQREDGTWPYVRGEGGSLAMTAGGLASIITAFDWTHRSDSLRRISNDPLPQEAIRALGWLQSSGNVVKIPTSTTDYVGLDAFTVGRAARTFGLKYIGGRDWYLELAQRFIAAQDPNGSWGRTPNQCADTVIDTAYTTLFLAQGRPPVLMNKLRHDDADWQNHPHDVANLSAFTGRELERPLRWQIVDLSRDGADWVDAPILYITGQRAPDLRAKDLARIKAFVEAGGIVFTHADSPGKAFSDWVKEKLAPGILPTGVELAALPDDHAIYSMVHKLREKPRLLAGGNTARLMLIHSPQDLAAAWDGNADGENLPAFQFGANLYAYAIGKNPPKHRFIPRQEPPVAKPLATFVVARIQHGGDWNPEPAAWLQFQRTFYEQTGATAVVQEAGASDLKPETTMAHVVGAGELKLTAEEATALRQYVEAGGILLVESFGGDSAFTASVQKNLLPTAFPNVTFAKPAADQPPLRRFQDVCDDLQLRHIRPFVVEHPERDGALMVASVGKGYVVFSPLDLTAGLLGSNTWGIAGYAPDYASGIVKNLLVWAGTRPK